MTYQCPSCITRQDILNWLRQWGPAYLSELAQRLSMDRSTLAYHLGQLEKEHRITSEYKILVEPKDSKGKAARYYSVVNLEKDK